MANRIETLKTAARRLWPSARTRRALHHWWGKVLDGANGLFFVLSIAAALGLAIYFGGDILGLIQAIGTCDPDPQAANACKALADGGSFKLISAVALSLAGLLTLAFAHRRSKALADNARNMTRQVELARREQLSARFTEAVKQLGDDKITIRLGGIAGLWAMATESDHPEDRIMVLDLLCAFVRESSKQVEVESEETELNRPSIPTDIAIVMEKLTSIKSSYSERSREKHYRLDLQRSNIRGIIEDKANLFDAILIEADLSAAVLPEADLSYANLTLARLYGAYLHKANLYKAALISAKLVGADLSNANLSKADLTGASLSGARLENTDFSEAMLFLADLSQTKLYRTNLSKARLDSVNFSGSRFIEVNLKATNLSSVRLTRSQYQRALTDENTIPPNEFLPEDPEDTDAPASP